MQKEGLSDSLRFTRVTEGGGMSIRRVFLCGFFSNFLICISLCFLLSPSARVPLLSLLSCLPVSRLDHSVRLPVYPSVRLSTCGCQKVTPPLLTSCVSVPQPCHQLPSPPMMWTSTSRPRPTTRSTVASKGPRSSWRSGTATAWRG